MARLNASAIMAQKKVVFSALYPMWHYHFVTELNLVQKHLDQGDEVFIMECNESLLACECNKEHDLHHCLRCIGIRQDGLASLSGNPQKLAFAQSNLFKSKADALFSDLKSISDLKSLKYKGFDVGSAVFSSLVDHTMNTAPNINDNRKKILKLIADSINVFENFNAWLKANKPDQVYIFNGRYAVARALLRACEQNQIPFATHERTGNLNKVQLFHMGFPHDPRIYPQMAQELWKKHKNDINFLKEGANFFEERPKGQLTGWQPFIGMQKAEMLPNEFQPSRRNIAIFGSSESEMLAIEGLMDGVEFPSQLKVYIDFLSSAYERCPEVFFYLRLHPNSKTEKNIWWEKPELKNLPKLKIIEPDSEVSSYALLAACEKAVGLSTTLCLEATYWGKPSIVLGPTYYSGIDAVYEPSNLEEACKLILEPSLPCKPKENAIMYGAFWRCYGDDLPYSAPKNFYTMDFKGRILEARREVHEWLGACEKRPEVLGIKKWLRDRSDRREFHKLLKKCDGWFAESPKSH